MDELDRQILRLLSTDGRMAVKEIAQKISLTSPAVSERIHKLEKSGVIAGYTVVLSDPSAATSVNALISLSVPTQDRVTFLSLVENHPSILRCFHVTGSYSFIVKVRCEDMHGLEHLINRLQQLGQTSTQIILSTPVDRQIVL